MKYVPIVPPGAEKLLEMADGVEKVFCFADLAAKDEDYAKWFRLTDMEVMMDHPVYELQPALNVEDTLRVLDVVQPDVTTIPDVHEDQETTHRMFEQYAPLMKSEFPHIRLMGVPQGLSHEEIIASAKFMLDSNLCDMLAIGIKRSIPDLDRLRIIREISTSSYGFIKNVEFHLLGARWPYINERLCGALPSVLSIDTAEPVNAAMRGVSMLGHAMSESAVKRDANFMNMSLRAMMQSRMICKNIMLFQALLATLPASPAKDQTELV